MKYQALKGSVRDVAMISIPNDLVSFFIGNVYCQPAVNSILGLVPAGWQ